MLFHLSIVFLQIAALAAFLVLWYFWVKRKLGVTFGLDNEEHVLFPFRYFSWVLIGVLVITCLVQVHFLRVSASVHERLASMTVSFKKNHENAMVLSSLKESMAKLRHDVKSGFKTIRAENRRRPALVSLPKPATQTRSSGRVIASAKPPAKPVMEKTKPTSDFSGEAKASSRRTGGNNRVVASRTPNSVVEPTSDSMSLQLMGRVRAGYLRVRRRPLPKAPVIEKLKLGQQVKVTEKRLSGDTMWFRIITPSGRAGWVDYRFLKLEKAPIPKA
jgi:branched-subunit amino acid transport protein AzlD